MNKIEKMIAELCPNGVEYKKLSKIVNILNGYAFKSDKYVDSGIRVIRISDVQKGKMSDKDLKFYPNESENEIKNYLLRKNDLVMSLTGNVGRVAMLSASDLPAGLNQRVACIRLKNTNEVLIRYLFHFFDQDTFEKKAMECATGGGQKNMSTTWLGSQEIPVPPMGVQEEIVRILDKFTSLEAELEAELEGRKKQYNHYRDALLSSALPTGTLEPKTLGEICIKTNNIKWKDETGKNYEYIDLSSVNRQNNEIEETQIINATNAPSRAQQIVRSSDVIFGTTRPTLMRLCYIPEKYDNQICSTGFCVLRADQSQVLAKYLYFAITTSDFKKYVDKNQEGAGYPSISDSRVKNYKIIIPPLPEQERIVAILDKFDALVNDISVGLPAEIAARRKQYEYYRNKLLTFTEAA